MNIKDIKDPLSNFLGVTAANTIVLMGFLYAFMPVIIEGLVDGVADQMYLSINSDINQATEFDLTKIANKLSDDPNDAKPTDLSKGIVFCNGNFMRLYVPSISADRQLKVIANCATIKEAFLFQEH